MFECELTDRRFRELYAKLADLLQQALQIEEKQEEKDEEEEKKNGSVNSIRIYQLCKNCVEEIRVIGVEKEQIEKEKIIII